MSNPKPKILVCGDVDGKFKTLFTRVKNINEKSGPFDFLICVGRFFGASGDNWEPYSNGSLPVTVPTYVLGPVSPDSAALYPDINGCELCPNVSYLGKRGQITTSSGLRLAYVSGVEGDASSQPHTFSASDVLTVRDVCLRGQPSFRGVDILVSSSWPKDVLNLDEKADKRRPNGSHLLSWLAAQIKPRYHFCAAEGLFYERPPYMNHNTKGDSAEHVTRFIGLAKVGNAEKQKWLYALTIEPIDNMKASELYQHTTDTTRCPYSGSMLQPNLNISNKPEETSQFFYDMDAPNDNQGQRKRSKRQDDGGEKKQRPVFDQGTCWFCLASAEVEKHLVISIGTEVYLALAKGALVPDHILILPVGHHQSLSDIPETVQKEIKQFKSALKKFYKQQDKVPVYFERNFKTSHLQIQVVPIKRELAIELKDIFQECAEAHGIQLDELPVHAKLEQIAPAGTSYFYVELPSGEKLFTRTRKDFPLQFGREVLSSKPVLDIADRSDWRDCKLTKEEESDQAKQFRDSFQPFDFTL